MERHKRIFITNAAHNEAEIGTWLTEPTSLTDVEYVNADLLTSAESEVARLRGVVGSVCEWANQDHICCRYTGVPGDEPYAQADEEDLDVLDEILATVADIISAADEEGE